MIGILALQGAFREHQRILETLGRRTVLVKKPSQLEAIEALVLPGGESTTMTLLIEKYALADPLKKFIASRPTLATCAGLILLAKNVDGGKGCLNMLDVSVSRNAFGRQVDSFEANLDISALGQKPYPAVFIRAPWIEKVEKNVDILGTYNDKIVAVRQDNILGLAFHPELTKDTRFHQLFISMIKSTNDERLTMNEL